MIAGAALLLGAGAARAALPAKPGPAILIVGNVAEFRLARRWFWQDWGGEPRDCMLLRLLSFQPAPRFAVAVTGLGSTRLAPVAGAQCPAASSPVWRDQIAVALPRALRPAGIALSLDPDAAGSSGRIVAYGPAGELGSATVKLSREEPGTFSSALGWFLGLVVPSGLAYFIAQLQARAAERQKKEADRAAARTAEEERLAAFRDLEPDRVDAMADDIETMLKADVGSPGQMTYEILKRNGIIEAIPSRERADLIRQFQADDQATILHTLRTLFPAQAARLKDRRRGGTAVG